MVDWSKLGIHWQVPVIDGGEYWIRSNWHSCPDAELLKLMEESSVTIIDMTWDPCPREWIVTYAQRLAKVGMADKVLFLTGDYDSDPHPNMIWFPGPVYRMSWVYQHYRRDISPKPNWRISSLNRVPRPHRAYFYYQLLKKSWQQQNLFSWKGFDNESERVYMFDIDSNYRALPGEVIEFISRSDTQRQVFDWDNMWDSPHGWNHPAYEDCVLNIVTETASRDQSIYLTEKICKPLAAGQLFLMVGDRGSVDFLRSLGFDCADQDLGHHTYDSLIGFQNRIDSLLNLVDNLYDNLYDIRERNLPALEHNMRWFISQEFRSRLLKPLAQRGLIKAKS